MKNPILEESTSTQVKKSVTRWTMHNSTLIVSLMSLLLGFFLGRI